MNALSLIHIHAVCAGIHIFTEIVWQLCFGIVVSVSLIVFFSDIKIRDSLCVWEWDVIFSRLKMAGFLHRT